MSEREQALTDEVVASFAAAPSPRLREVARSLVRHLHAFAREVRLTDAEWEHAIAFLTRAGHLTDDRRQEVVLLSDVLGLSALVVAMAAPAAASAGAAATESTVLGPFFVPDAPEIPFGGDIARGAAGTPCLVEGTVRGIDGMPVSSARIDAWEADEEGLYDVQRAGGPTAGRGWLRTDAQGAYRFWAVVPAPYPIPDDGPVGELLAASGRSPMRPAHLHLKVTAPGYRTLVTHVFVAGDEHLSRDAVFGVRESLIADVVRQDAGTAPDGSVRSGPWAHIAFDVVLEPTGGPDG